jgi:hypothetical protein
MEQISGRLIPLCVSFGPGCARGSVACRTYRPPARRRRGSSARESRPTPRGGVARRARGPSHAGRREQACRWSEPHYHQACTATADQPHREPCGSTIGSVARLDQVYDLVEGNIGSEVRAKISAIAKELEHPLAQPVAKGHLPARLDREPSVRVGKVLRSNARK